jgi:hypothetical protein
VAVPTLATVVEVERAHNSDVTAKRTPCPESETGSRSLTDSPVQAPITSAQDRERLAVEGCAHRYKGPLLFP